MISANDKSTDTNIDSTQAEQKMAEKQNKLLSGIIERATKSSLGRKKLNPSVVESAVAKKMEEIHKNPTKLRLVVLGGGSFGTAMANLAARNGCDTTLWVRNKRTVKAMAKSQMNKKYLPGYKLDDRLKYSHELQAAVKDTDIIFIAVPGLAFRETLKSIAPFISGQ